MTAKSFKSQQIKHFKFWLEEDLQDGMQYRYSLFHRIRTLDYSQRKKLYRYANQLAQKGADILVTYDENDCHLWLNLKHKALETQPQ